MPIDEPESHTEELRLARVFFVLPEPISVPDGYQVLTSTWSEGVSESSLDDPQVSVIFHQVSTTHGRTAAAMEALGKATGRAIGLPSQLGDGLPLGAGSEWTVAEAVTTWDSPDRAPDNETSRPATWAPREDLFARCLYAARQSVRAYRQATGMPSGLPTYVRSISPVLVYSADGVREKMLRNGKTLVVTRPTQDEWDGPVVMFLDHANFPDPFGGGAFDEEIEARFWYWLAEQERGNPLNLWRERWIEARRAHEVLGEEGQAVILANTSCEVMLNAVLGLLIWEDGASVADAAGLFVEGKLLSKLSQGLAPRLRGNWSTDRGAVGAWYRDTYRLRHRVVHGGYSPSVREGERALEAAHNLQTFVFDRIADRRTSYPRAALMTVAEEGLRARGMWSGKIKRFFEQVAPTEPCWRDAYSAWYRNLVDATAP